MMQLHLSDSPLVAVVNDAEVANVAAVISLLKLVNDAAVSDDAAVALSVKLLVNDAAFAIVTLLQLKFSMLL